MRDRPFSKERVKKSSKKGTGKLSTQVKPVSSSKLSATDLPEPEVPVKRIILCIQTLYRLCCVGGKSYKLISCFCPHQWSGEMLCFRSGYLRRSDCLSWAQAVHCG